MPSKLLRFELQSAAGMQAFREAQQRFFPDGKIVLNRTKWRGMEPRTCAVTRVNSHSTTRRSGDAPSPLVLNIEVTHRPKGHISYASDTRYDGWTATVPARSPDGQLLNTEGKSMDDGQQMAYVAREVYEDVDFNDLDFGELKSEAEIDGVERTSFNSVMSEVTASGRVTGSCRGTFVAGRRNRPLRKIILSNAETMRGVDAWGTEILNINLKTPQFEQVLMDELTKLMCEVIEGRASIENIGNDSVCFVQLSKVVIDCEPNELGMESWFNMLHCYTPIGFLEDLAKRLMAVYEVKAGVIEGKEGGIVLRHDRKAS